MITNILPRFFMNHSAVYTDEYRSCHRLYRPCVRDKCRSRVGNEWWQTAVIGIMNCCCCCNLAAVTCPQLLPSLVPVWIRQLIVYSAGQYGAGRRGVSTVLSIRCWSIVSTRHEISWFLSRALVHPTADGYIDAGLVYRARNKTKTGKNKEKELKQKPICWEGTVRFVD